MRRLDPAPRADRITHPHSNEWLMAVTERLGVYSSSADPTVDEVPNKQWLLHKNTTTGDVHFYFNDDGTLRKVNLTVGLMAASNVTVTPAGNITSTDVQAALQELDTELVERFYSRRFLLMGA